MWKPMWNYVLSFFRKPERTHRVISEMDDMETFDAFCILTGDVWRFNDMKFRTYNRDPGGYKYITLENEMASLTAFMWNSGELFVRYETGTESISLKIEDFEWYLKTINVNYDGTKNGKTEVKTKSRYLG